MDENVKGWKKKYDNFGGFGEKSKEKSMWQESKDRRHQQQYRSVYGRRNYRKGM